MSQGQAKQQIFSFQQQEYLIQNMNLGCDLHTHYSSLINYSQIFQLIKDNNLSEYLFYNKQTNELIFSDQQENNNLVSFKKQEKEIFKLMKRYIDQQYFLGTDLIDKQFKESFALGHLFYHIFKSQIFYKHYINAIYENMLKIKIFHLEIRIKLDFFTQKRSYQTSGEIGQLLSPEMMLSYFEIARQQNDKYKDLSIILIVQFNRDHPKLSLQLDNFMSWYEQNFQKFQKLIVGIDFTGQETSLINKQLMQSQNLIQKMLKLELQFYNHAGELISDISENFDWKNNIQLQNVLFQITDLIPQNKQLFIHPPRIGHGTIFLQYLLQLKCSQNNKEYVDYKNLIKENQICFEICPLSNYYYYNKYLMKEIYEEFLENICICVDDENKIHRNLRDNFQFLFYFIKLSYYQIKELAKNSIKFASLKNQNLKLEKFNAMLLSLEEQCLNQDNNENNGQQEKYQTKNNSQNAWWWYKRANPYSAIDQNQQLTNKKIKLSN